MSEYDRVVWERSKQRERQPYWLPKSFWRSMDEEMSWRLSREHNARISAEDMAEWFMFQAEIWRDRWRACDEALEQALDDPPTWSS